MITNNNFDFQIILENQNFPSILLDKEDFALASFNQLAVLFWKEELEEPDFFRLNHPIDNGFFLDLIQKIQKNNTDNSALIKTFKINVQNEKYNFDINVKYSEKEINSKVYLLINFTKIANEEKFDLKNHFNQMVLDSIPQPIIILDKELNFKQCNSSFEEIAKIKQKNIPSNFIRDIHSQKGKENEFLFRVQNIIKGTEDFQTHQNKINFGDNDSYTCDVFRGPIKNPSSNEVEGILIILNIIEKVNSIDLTEFKRKEKELEIKEKNYKMVFEQLRDLYFQTDIRGNIELLSPSLSSLTKWKEKELIGKNVSLLYKDPAQSKKIFKELLKKNVVYDYEIDLLNKNGEVINCSLTSQILNDKETGRVFVNGIIRDISLRKRISVENNKLKTAIEQSQVAVIITDKKGNIEYINPKFSEITGYTLSEAIGQNPRILKSGRTTHEDYVNLWKTISQGKVWKGEFSNIKKNGSIYWNSAIITPVFDEDGKITNYIGIQEDITENKRILQKLADNEKQYRLLAENTSDIIWLYNLQENKYKYISPSIKSVCGYEQEEALNMTFSDMFADYSESELHSVIYERINKYYLGDSSQIFKIYESRRICKNDTVAWFETATKLILNENGEVIEILGSSRNIDERKQNEQIIFENNIQLKELINTKDKLFSIIAHDLRSPFSGFLGLTDLLANNLDQLEKDELSHITKVLFDGAKNTFQLLENLLDWTRIQSHKQEFNPISLNFF